MQRILGPLIFAAILASGAARADKPPPLDGETPISVGKPAPMVDPRHAPGPPIPRPGAGPSALVLDTGTGFIVADGRVLTNKHVVDGCGRVIVRNARGESMPARVDAIDEIRDLALLAVSPGFGAALVFRGGPVVARGESVITYGFPLSGVLSSGPSLTTGNVSALSGLGDNQLHFQISAPVQPGNSGGPLLDAQAHVIGVVVSKLDAAKVARLTNGDIPQNVNFAIKGEAALAFLTRTGIKPALADSSGPEQRPAAIGAVADAATVFIQCMR